MTIRIPDEAGRGHLAMLAFSALVAGSFSLGALAAPLIAPSALNALRFLLTAIILGVAAYATAGVTRQAFAAPWRYLVLGGLFAIYFVTMFEGLKTAAPVSAAAVFTLTPVMSAIFGLVLLRQRSGLVIWLALAIGAAGAIWVIFRADWNAILALRLGRGEMIFFFGCIAHALYTPMVPRLNRGESPVVFSFGMVVAGIVVISAWGAADILATEWSALPPVVWVTIVYVTVAASAMTFVLLQYASMRLPAAKVMAYTYLTPFWVICWELAQGRPAPPALILAGVGLIVAALLMLLLAD